MTCEHCGAEMVKQVRCCGGRDCSCHGELIEVEVDDCPNPNCFLDGMLGDGISEDILADPGKYGLEWRFGTGEASLVNKEPYEMGGEPIDLSSLMDMENRKLFSHEKAKSIEYDIIMTAATIMDELSEHFDLEKYKEVKARLIPTQAQKALDGKLFC